jgi:catechol-2,3-dioxygenase
MAQTPLQVGHVALNVKDVSVSERFYTDVVGLEIAARVEGATFLTCGTLHHDIVLFQVSEPAETAMPPAVGLNHIAFQLPDRTALRERYDLLQEKGVSVRPIEHNTTLSFYFHDPDGNRIELYCDRYDNGLEVIRTKGPMARPLDMSQLDTL